MKLVFSRKGFDSANGGRPSPILDGRPISLPIPERTGAATTYAELGLGAIVEQVTRNRLTGCDGCHDDPMFADGFCWFGQSGSAQGHLRKQGVGPGDMFLFFGLFSDPLTGQRHHRFFAHMQVLGFGPAATVADLPEWRDPPRIHPHLTAKFRRQNTIYFGPATVASHANDSLRLSRPDGPTSRWLIPAWLTHPNLSRHGNPERWQTPGELETVSIGQEFVCDIAGNDEALTWLNTIVSEIGR